jgi:hypothetical protein
VLDAAGTALWHAATRRPALVILEQPDAADAEPLVAKGAGAVAIITKTGVRVVTGDGGWSAVLSGAPRAARSGAQPGRHLVTTSRDAMVAGFVPGTVLGWSWTDTLAHAVALAASAGPGGDVDLEAYERLLPTVTVSSQPT